MGDESLRSGLLILLPFALFLIVVFLLRESLLIIILNLMMNYHLRKIRLRLQFLRTRLVFISLSVRNQDENE